MRSTVLNADLADRPAGDRLVDEAWNVWNGLDAWLQIAGADVLTGASSRLSFEAKLDLLWSVDVVATIRLCRDVGQRMKAQGHGVIVTMGWDQAETGMEGDSGELFAATKGAVMAFTRSLALSLAPRVRVNALAPGWIKTDWGETASNLWQTARPPRDPAGPLGYARRHRARGAVSRQPGCRVHDRADRADQWWRGSIGRRRGRAPKLIAIEDRVGTGPHDLPELGRLDHTAPWS